VYWIKARQLFMDADANCCSIDSSMSLTSPISVLLPPLGSMVSESGGDRSSFVLENTLGFGRGPPDLLSVQYCCGTDSLVRVLLCHVEEPQLTGGATGLNVNEEASLVISDLKGETV